MCWRNVTDKQQRKKADDGGYLHEACYKVQNLLLFSLVQIVELKCNVEASSTTETENILQVKQEEEEKRKKEELEKKKKEEEEKRKKEAQEKGQKVCDECSHLALVHENGFSQSMLQY